MRLLVFAPYFPPHVGGVEAYVRDLNAELLDQGLVDAITVLAPRIPPESPACELPGPGYLVLRYPAFEAIPNFPAPAPWRRGFASTMRAALRSDDYDVVVCHTRFFLSTLFALGFSRRTRLPLIHVEHGSDHVHLGRRAHETTARVYDLTLGRLALSGASVVVAVSQAAARFVESQTGRSAQVLHRGVDHARYDVVAPCAELLEWAAGGPLVTFVGRLIDGKGVADLVEAFAGLERGRLGRRGALLCIVGDGPQRDGLRALCVQRGIADRCRFAGAQPEARALELMRAADVVVNPSYTEGLPTSVLEAALLGRAILASDVGGTSEVVAHGSSALLFPAGDVEALRGGLERLLGDAALRGRLGERARREARERFDGRASARRFAEIAGGLVERSALRRA